MSPIITSILGIISSVFGNISEKQKSEISLLLQQDENITKLALAQIDVNKVEAGSPSIFISGARPAVMWMCVIAFGIEYILKPLTIYFCTILGHAIPVMPQFNMVDLMGLLGGLLGIGGMRSWEKLKGLTK